MHIPSHLIESIKIGNCVLFVGAGLSLGANLPTWGRLMLELVNELECEKGEISDKNDIADYINRGEFLDAAEILRERLGDTSFLRFMRQRFSDSKLESQATHKILTKLTLSAILTTNFDTLIEDAYSPQPPVYTQFDTSELAYALTSNEFYVLKVHGNIHRADTIVLGKSDYQKLMYANPAYKQYLSSLLSIKTVLFIGFSLTDPDLLALFDELKTTFGGHNNNHYALMNDISDLKATRMKKNYNLDVINYKPSDSTHPEVLEFLTRLVDETSNRPAKTMTLLDNIEDNSEYIFISYARPDQTYAEKIERFLIGLGYRVFLDRTDIRSGDDWDEKIEHALRTSDKMVLLLSKASMPERKEVRREWFYFDQNNKPIIPLYIEQCELNSRLISLNYIDTRKRFKEALHDLKHTLAGTGGIDIGKWELAELAANLNNNRATEFPIPEWIPIREGNFIIGANDLGIPEHTINLPEFLVAKTPVTHEQYQLFISRSSPPHPIPYDDFGDLKNYSWNPITRQPPADKKTHPVVLVSAFDAEAYCNWLTKVLTDKLPDGYQVMLPSESEWERAARSTDGRTYPWGEWFDESFLPINKDSTQPVATHKPECATSEGCYDIIGNVYEWTRSALWSYPYDPTDGREAPAKDNERVLRGGCWQKDEPEESYRSAYRHSDEPDYKDSVYGFRPVIVKFEV